MSDTSEPSERNPFGAHRASGGDDPAGAADERAGAPRSDDFDTAVFGSSEAAPRTEPIRTVDEGHLAAAPYAAPAVVATAPERSRRRGLLVPVVVAAVLAALLGGGIGAASVLALAPRTTVAATGSSGSTSGNGPISVSGPTSATAISAVAAKASPSVVTISVSESSGQEAGTGSGIVLTTDGDVLTNTHVVTLDGASSDVTITATTSDGRIYQAKTVGTDPTNDLAVIKLTDASGLRPATFGDSSKLDVGDAAIAIGAPLDLPNTVTSGIVSALNRSISVQSSAVPDNGSDSGDGSGGTSPFGFPNLGGGTAQTATSAVYLSVVQTDTAINPGNSGGALLNSNGDVIGVNVAIAGTGSDTTSTTQSGNIGVGFAIPSNIAHRIGLELMKGQKATHGLLGVTPADPTSTSTRSGATVSALTAGGAASKAGLRQGDVITAFNGIAIAGREDLTAQVRALPGGSTTTLSYERDGTAHTARVTLGTFKG